MKNLRLTASLALCLSVSAIFVTGCTGGGSGSSGSGSGGSGGTTTPPATVVPTVASISPSSVSAGATATSITVTGTGFTSSTAIQVGDVVENTTYSSSSQVSATVSDAQLAQGGLLPVIALNADATSGAGAVVDLTVNNPVPAIVSVVPGTLISGGVARTVSVLGTGFVPTTVVQVGGTARPTSFVTSGEVIAVLSAADLATGGMLAVTAVNPTPMGGTSAALQLPVNNPLPGITSLSPSTVLTGGTTPVTVTVTGLNFFSSSVVQVSGLSRATTFVSSTQLTFQLTVADQANVASLQITVMNPAPGGGTSLERALNVAVPTPTPTILSVSPTQFIVGSPTTEIQVQISGTGTTFGTTGISDTVDWNGTALFTNGEESGYNGTYLLAQVPASLLAALGTASITVVSPTSTPTTSNAVTVTISNPPAPTLTSLSPSSGPINTATVITLTGTGFTTSSTVAFNGTSIPATFVASNELTVSLPAASVSLPGNGSFTVSTPAPGGGTTTPLLYTAYIGLTNNSVVFNPVNGLFYASVPSSAGAPYGNSIVSIDPETGALGTPIPVGSEPNKLAISSDGTILWVGLDGASAVRQVNLTSGTAGLQFSLGGNGGVYANPGTALALAALPGAPNSVVVSTSTAEYGIVSLAIFDSGVLRGSATTTSGNYSGVYALQVDGTRGEVYAASPGNYYTFTYGTSGLTLLASSTTSASYATTTSDEIEVAGGHLYTDFGQVFDAESGSLLGTFYNGATIAASGPTTADTTLGKAFVLDNSAQYQYGNYNQIQVFNTSDFTSASQAPIPVSVTTNNSGTESYPSRLTRWGTNGLAFRTSQGLYSLRSNLVKDLSTTSADIGVTVAVSGGTTTGTNTTYTATISNAGPSAATNVALTASIPGTGVLQSVTPSAGVCSISNGISCNLGGLADGASVTVAFAVLQTASGSAALTAQVSASETDPTASNNQATGTATITGSAYNLPPTITAISPASILAGSSDTTLTVTGTGFSSGSTVQLGGTALPTTLTSATSLTATVPAAMLPPLGWSPVTVANPTPGGGTSAALPLSTYAVITLGVNHILYDPYSRKIMASVGSGSSTVNGNSIVAITPETATVGTPVSIGSQPTNLALTSDGRILYTILTGSQSVARFNMLTQQPDYTFAVPANSSFDGGIALRGVATVPGTEDTIALDLAAYSGNAIFDFDPANQTAAIRGQATGPYTGSCNQFLDATNMVDFNIDSFPTLNHYTITSAGFSYYNNQQYTESTLDQFGCFKLSGGIAYSVSGGVANPAPSPAVQLGVFQTASGTGYLGQGNVAPDSSLQQTYFVVNSGAGGQYSSTADSIETFDNNTYLPTGFTPLGFAAAEGSNATYTVADLIRWGQDGLAVLTSTGHIYLLRGAAVVPGELTTNAAATLASSSLSTITHGSGNTLLTLTGTNFLSGAAVNWNGSYRTTTIVDATHVTVAIPASDLATAGSATLTAVNPGATASSGLTITID